MYQNVQDSIASLFFSLLAFCLLYWNGWILSAYFFFLVSLYFYAKFKKPQKITQPEDFKVCIIGAGVSGICMGKRLNELGIRYVILEKSSNVGGTWWENKYPGVACDVPSHFYSFSFCPNPNWSKKVSPGPEIQAYLEYVASRFDVYRKIKFNERVTSAAWDDTSNKWRVTTADGTLIVADVTISCRGGLHYPKIPDFPGKEEFLGEAFHTAEWIEDFDPKDKTIAVIGTGASAVQVIPNIADMGLNKLLVFQRTPCWSPPRFDFFYPDFIKSLFSLLPLIRFLHRLYFFLYAELLLYTLLICKPSSTITKKISKRIHKNIKKWISMAVKDSDLAEKLTPKYSLGAKRITPSDEYLKTFNKPFVHLITDPIERITKDGIKTATEEHKIDQIIFATGFDIQKAVEMIDVVGINGKHLHEVYGDTPRAYVGITHPDTPNSFIILGPGTGLGHGSAIFMIECQVNYAIDGITQMLNTKAKSMRLKPEKLEEYWDWSQQEMKSKVFADNSEVSGWYRNARGINTTLYPASITSYWWKTRKCNLKDYIIKY